MSTLEPLPLGHDAVQDVVALACALLGVGLPTHFARQFTSSAEPNQWSVASLKKERRRVDVQAFRQDIMADALASVTGADMVMDMLDVMTDADEPDAYDATADETELAAVMERTSEVTDEVTPESARAQPNRVDKTIVLKYMMAFDGGT